MKKITISFTLMLMFLICSCSGINLPTITESCNQIESEESIVISSSTIEDFEDYGLETITIDLSDTNITDTGIYTSLNEVGAYIYTYHTLPSNYEPKSSFNKSNYTSTNKLSCGGDRFYNREGLLPTQTNRTYTECDIDYKGGSRNAKRIVYSSDFLIFYTDDHYASFSILRFVE